MEKPRSKARALILTCLAMIVALVAAIGASAGVSSAIAGDTSSTAAPTQPVQQAGQDRWPGGLDCPERDRSPQDDSAAPDSSTTPAPAPEV